MSSLIGCLLLFLKIYVLKIGENYRGKHKGNRKLEISVFEIRARLDKIIKLVEHRVAVFSKTFYLLRQQK